MKSYQQQTQSILRKARKKKTQKRAVLGGIAALAVTTLAFVLFLPFPSPASRVTAYKDSDYYTVIEKLDEISHSGTPTYKNNFEKWTAQLSSLFSPKFGSTSDFLGVAPPTAPGNSNESVARPDGSVGSTEDKGDSGTSDDNYQETTDNQVEGVIEADLLKRTNTHAFYLSYYYNSGWVGEGEDRYYQTDSGFTLRIYTIEGQDSKLVSTTRLELPEGYGRGEDPEMYLSKDGKQLTVIRSCSMWHEKEYYTSYYTMVFSIDVSDPASPKESEPVYISGNYNSSRLVDGELLLITNHRVNKPNFDDESTFLPQYGSLDDMQTVKPENIVCPENANASRYTVVTKLDERTLEVQGSVALLSYSNAVTVSATNLFLTHSYTDTEGGVFGSKTRSMTELSCVSYDGEGLAIKGCVEVEGEVKNQYSMDEYENTLRVVTTTRRSDVGAASTTNANLYCIDLTDFSIVGKVEQFAPDGETVESVRFDGTKAYVCTAVVVTFSDPVFFFDLSDMNNITYTDTGTIDGYSSSLIQFGHGYLVGIGYGKRGEVKIEAYAQGDGEVVSTDAVTFDGEISSEYKSYLIDREDGFIGLGAYRTVDKQMLKGYLFLTFEDGRFTGEKFFEHDAHYGLDEMRAFVEDGYLYLFGTQFQVIDLAKAE